MGIILHINFSYESESILIFFICTHIHILLLHIFLVYSCPLLLKAFKCYKAFVYFGEQYWWSLHEKTGRQPTR